MERVLVANLHTASNRMETISGCYFRALEVKDSCLWELDSPRMQARQQLYVYVSKK
jgi:hypothetical protein